MSVSGSPSESGYLFASQHLTSAIDDGDDDIDSLPSSSASDSSLEDHISMYDIDDDDDDESDAEAEWQESMRQLELLLTMVVIPFAGKFLGRKCAYWGWAKFMEWKHPFEGSIGYGVEFPRAIPAITSATL
ncbi:hypothetical protein LOZ53_005716 [Ophidiomyces ophidiicola]|uniref:uncharacterized protein n=1 Tax=Ophidiomyces ophidiicola TaxID=1387563 RepID=UPI0020C354CD|nr:uncharacterized protein LOZ57_004234 [Ophidiomyces ophidiicola]KAI1912336.1 hypothetical protein LOZ61_003341 [Ophidiomyces ophidiicola]KAI1920294.1 hypothetical protein LOZ64_001921 [Ophidiomyces ophidiicola]KAI1924147.1 hypothetical protein LOZ60_004906 [Ophidiomyces ophidiicola]KAI1945204.1 hypothetical protein LOZ57_004234 [Ophidiomyces ophidiicola]KAI1959986.1 hypothetical protein LOZ59_002933 [Ophidiomyces ophidiicola]